MSNTKINKNIIIEFNISKIITNITYLCSKYNKSTSNGDRN